MVIDFSKDSDRIKRIYHQPVEGENVRDIIARTGKLRTRADSPEYYGYVDDEETYTVTFGDASRYGSVENSSLKGVK